MYDSNICCPKTYDQHRRTPHRNLSSYPPSPPRNGTHAPSAAESGHPSGGKSATPASAWHRAAAAAESEARLRGSASQRGPGEKAREDQWVLTRAPGSMNRPRDSYRCLEKTWQPHVQRNACARVPFAQLGAGAGA